MSDLLEQTTEIVERFKGLGLEKAWELAPNELKRYKCENCKLIVWETPCPVCGNSTIKKMCPSDHCHCSEDIVESVKFCEVCGSGICPVCGTHDILALSRITGYINSVESFNMGKKQELKDRNRYIL
jgi:hypothetical protein